MRSEYRVRWEIDIEAESPREAAERALEIQRDAEGVATCFTVFDPHGVHADIDLEESKDE